MNTTILTALLSSSLLTSLGCQANAVNSPEIKKDADLKPIVLDGDCSEWPQPNSGLADERYIYLNFSPKSGEANTIQAAPFTTRLRIDVDQSPQTGRPMQWMSLEASMQQPQGVDLLIELSPKNELGTVGIGSAVTRYNDPEQGISIGHANIGFMFLPTYSSTQYEARIDRLAPGSEILPKSGPIEIVIDQVDADNRFLWSTTIRVVLPELGELSKSRADIPINPPKSARVMSSNVLFSSPLENPQAFSRVLDAINPDVILYQEWFNTPSDQVQSWLNTHAGTGWQVHMPSPQAGVAIATRERIITTYESVIPPSNTGRPARGVAALIDTDAGELLAISVHLKCCGSAGSEEDTKRIEQAKSINAFVRSVHKKHPNAKVVIAGDFNLVGSYEPMSAMIDSLGIDGRDLSTINAQQIGDASMVTWNDEKSRFSPGRLDWMLIDESMSQAANSFILDTRSLSNESLEAVGLYADDSKASDHLPIVIDLIDAE
jgi:endonuclease/exonuclease/phosphatase family metal-dependent hydrolase